MTVRGKLLIPAGAQVLALVLVLGLTVWGVSASRCRLRDDARLRETASQAKVAQEAISVYSHTLQDSPQLEQGLEAALRDVRAMVASTQIDRVEQTVAFAQEIVRKKQRNREIEKQLLKLTETSKSLSDTYIHMVVKNLVDPVKASGVTTLEKQVIVGAHFNSCTNDEVQRLFFATAFHREARQELLSCIRRAIENADRDVRQLADTPFRDMPKAALESNHQIDGLVQEYHANLESLERAQAGCDQHLGALVKDLEEQQRQSQVATNARIASVFAWIAGAVGLVAVATSVLNVLLAWQIGRTLRNLLAEVGDLAQAAVNGDLQKRGNAERIDAEFRPIVVGINATLDAVVGPLQVAADYVDRIARGDIPRSITETFRGDFNAIKNNLNRCMDALNVLVAGMRQMAEGQEARRPATSTPNWKSNATKVCTGRWPRG